MALVVGEGKWFVHQTASGTHGRAAVLALAAWTAVVSALLLAAQLTGAHRVVAASLVCSVAVLVAATLRLTMRARSRLDEFSRLHTFTSGIPGAGDLDQSLANVMRHACGVMDADVAEIGLLTRTGALRQASDRSGGSVVAIGPAPGDAVWERVTTDGATVLYPKTARHPTVRAYLTDRGMRDLLAVPLIDANTVIGVLSVYNRGAGNTFRRHDATALLNMANHATVALENARLLDRLRSEIADREHESLHDALTGLLNREGFHEELTLALDLCALRRANADSLAVLLLDLNRFKEINATLGHQVGDQLLVEVAGRLRAALPSEATIARLGGDEFAALLPNIESEAEAVSYAQSVQHALAPTLDIGGIGVALDAALGMALSPAHGTDRLTLMRRADVAMYAAKEQPEAAIQIYAADQEHVSTRQLALASDLRRALEHDHLEVFFQPKIDIPTGRVVGVEALVRWHHPELGWIPPDELVPLAEHTGLIGQVTSFVLARSLEQCALWRTDGIDLHVAVNLAARSLRDPELPNRVSAALERAHVPPGSLTLEVTEGEAMADSGVTPRVLAELRAHGIRIAIDDFGTGYSSLAYLARLAADEVKIDKSFVTNMADDAANAAIVRAVVDVAASVGLRVVAEGVEDERTRSALQVLGCQDAQGYHFSRPLPGPELSEWLRRQPFGHDELLAS